MTKLQVKLSKTKEGLLGQCFDKPEIIVVGQNKTEIRNELKEPITGYVEAFPETKDEFFTNNKMIELVLVKV